MATAIEAVYQFVSDARRLPDAILLQSGEDSRLSIQDLCKLIATIQADLRVAVMVFPGERSLDECRAMASAGCSGFIVKFETSSPLLYKLARPGLSLHARLSRIRELSQLSDFVGTGNILGLPGQSLRTVAADIVLARLLAAQLFVTSPFLPVPGTSFAHHPECSSVLLQRVVALARTSLPDSIIALSPASYTLDQGLLTTLLQGGANAVMVQITPVAERSLYQILPRRTDLSPSVLSTLVRELEFPSAPLFPPRAS